MYLSIFNSISSVGNESFQMNTESTLGNKPEKGVVLHTHLPKSLSCLVIGQFEPDCRLEGFKLARSNLDVEVTSLV